MVDETKDPMIESVILKSVKISESVAQICANSFLNNSASISVNPVNGL